ncbi:MAG: transketolase family protein [Bacillota bacterium]|nr:transketolase family protein [Bacillota bacterium]
MSKMIATRAAYGETLAELGGRDANIVVLDADLSGSTRTGWFAEKYPKRFVQMGIAEADMMGTAAGLAASGKTAFASTFAVFATGRAFDQVRQSIAVPGLNVKICATHAGLTVGEDGGSHQSVEDIALMRVLPNMTVIVPSDAAQTRWAVRVAAEKNGPFYVRLGRAAVPQIYDEEADFQLGKAKVLREGQDVTIIACGVMVSRALEAADALGARGIRARVLDMHTIKPLDDEAVRRAAEETGGIVTVEEHSIVGGLGGAVCESVCSLAPVPVIRVGVADVFGRSGKPDELLEAYGLTAGNIACAAERIIKMKKTH